MESLRLAGIVIWILTGDNEETAVAVSRMARHFDEKTRIVRIRAKIAMKLAMQLQKR